MDVDHPLVVRTDVISLAIKPVDMRAGTDTASAGAATKIGVAKPHCAYFFTNRQADRRSI